MKANDTQIGGLATAQEIKLTDYAFIRDVEVIAGIWDLTIKDTKRVILF